MPEQMTQTAPYPEELADLVHKLSYRPGWRFVLEDVDRDEDSEGNVLSAGLTLDIITKGYNSYHVDQGEHYRVHHYRPVPPATYNRQSWQRWLLEQIFLVEKHEACEFFKIDGKRPYPPSHGPGTDPYTVRELITEEEARTSFRGTLNP